MGGIVHDALIMQCAKKAKASRVYTLNAERFKLVAPEMAGLVMEPYSSPVQLVLGSSHKYGRLGL